jgi:hypothetical protein
VPFITLAATSVTRAMANGGCWFKIPFQIADPGVRIAVASIFGVVQTVAISCVNLQPRKWLKAAIPGKLDSIPIFGGGQSVTDSEITI